MNATQHGLELRDLIAERGEEPKLIGHGSGIPSNADGFTLFRFSDGTEVIETNAGLVTEDEDGFASLKHMCEEPDATTSYSVKRYNDGKTIGTVELTAKQFARYESLAQQPEGIIRLGAMPHDLYELDAEYQDTHEDTTVYLD